MVYIYTGVGVDVVPAKSIMVQYSHYYEIIKGKNEEGYEAEACQGLVFPVKLWFFRAIANLKVDETGLVPCYFECSLV